MMCKTGWMLRSLLGCVVLLTIVACNAGWEVPLPDHLSACLDRSDRFTTFDNGTVLDTCTKLMWMTRDYRNIEGTSPDYWEVALAWESAINGQSYGGYSDWRTPTLVEYKTVYDPKKTSLSHKRRPVGYPDVFETGGGEWCWVAEVAEWGTGHVHQVYTFSFMTGQSSSRSVNSEAHSHPPENVGSIRLVRNAS